MSTVIPFPTATGHDIRPIHLEKGTIFSPSEDNWFERSMLWMARRPKRLMLPLCFFGAFALVAWGA